MICGASSHSVANNPGNPGQTGVASLAQRLCPGGLSIRLLYRTLRMQFFWRLTMKKSILFTATSISAAVLLSLMASPAQAQNT
jgi:hypothetical protein